MYKETLFKGKITKIDTFLRTEHQDEIIFRLINFNNMFFFAEEISSGCIFPTYAFNDSHDSSKGSCLFRCYSNIAYARYFVFMNSYSNGKIFEMYITNDNMESPSIREVNSYLKSKDRAWKKKMEEMEAQNVYISGIDLIKEKIALLKNGNDIEFGNSNQLEANYVTYTPSIDLEEISEFGYDLSTQKDLCKTIGREEEIKKIIKTICINKDSILLVGESGSGKTVLIEQLALYIKDKNNDWLEDKTIFYINPSSLVEDTKYRGTFDEKIKKLINFCVEYEGRIILFIDEIHTLYGLGRVENSSNDALNILKPYLSRGEIIIIGTTTKDEYEKYMKNDPAFLRRCEKIELSSLDLKTNTTIIVSYIKELENKYNIKLELEEYKINEIAKYIINITEPKNQRVVGDVKTLNPTISKRIIKDAFAEAIYNKKNSVTIEDICYAIISCDRLSPSFRKRVAEELKSKLGVTKEITPVKHLVLIK